MSIEKQPDLQVLLTKLDRFHHLSKQSKVAIRRLPLDKAIAVAGSNIVLSDDRPDRCAIILKGMAFSYKLTGSGKRQILCFHLAGDIPDLESLHFGRTDISVAAVSGCHIGYVRYDTFHNLFLRHPSVAAVLWRETLLQGAIAREWLLNVGRRGTLAKLSHLACEMIMRHRAAGLTMDHSCDAPFTQTALADALGLSTVHVNRAIQELRRERLVELKNRRLTVLDWERLCVIADFNPNYLHLDHQPSVT